MWPRELPGIRKTAGQTEKQTRLFFGLSGGFSLCACAQQGQLRWPARKRWSTHLFQFVFSAFTALKTRFSASLLTQKRSVSLLVKSQFVFAAFAATNGVSLLLSLSQGEKNPRS